jgi:hypothetical protein
VNEDCGILYVASKRDRYVEEAFLSADSVKQRYPEMHITLFTDRPKNRLCEMDCFDQVSPIESMSGLSTASAEGKLNRLNCLLRSPYQRTLHLDTDTRVLTGELRSLFALLADIDVGMVETSIDDSFCRRQVGRPMFNCGVILYRNNDRTRAWLREWMTLTERNFLMVSQSPLPMEAPLSYIGDEVLRRRLLIMDQISQMEILSPLINKFDLAYKTLDYSWNHRGSRLPDNNRAPVRILHSPALRSLIHADLLAAAFSRSRFGRNAESRMLYDYIGTKYLDTTGLGIGLEPAN